ncbi:MAG: protein jag [Streptococcaceae bacterium]|jgi:spoIIIJ-associated protein|nr:protein jag [Streptococcaceae bacterium]
MSIYTGTNVQDAIEKGLKDLGIAKEKAHIQIKDSGSNGIFGFFKKPARVDIKPIAEDVKMQADRSAIRGVPDEVRAKSDPVKSASEATVELSQVVAAVKKAEAEKNAGNTDANFNEPVIVPEENPVVQPAITEEKQEKTVVEETQEVEMTKEIQNSVSAVESENSAILEGLDENEAVAELAKYLTKIAKEIGAPALVKVNREGSLIIFNLESKKQGILIGKHGKILNALQYLSQVFIHRVAKDKLSVVVNVGDYREKRKEVLVRLAKRTAQQVKRSGQPVFLEPMPAFERKQIHAVLSEDPYIKTHSEGDDPYRYLVVEKSGKQI